MIFRQHCKLLRKGVMAEEMANDAEQFIRMYNTWIQLTRLDHCCSPNFTLPIRFHQHVMH